jgi:hypothetical protein
VCAHGVASSRDVGREQAAALARKLCCNTAHDEFVGYFEWHEGCQLMLDEQAVQPRSGKEDMSSICGRVISVSHGETAYRCILQGPFKIHRGQVCERGREAGWADDERWSDKWVTGREMDVVYL